MNGQNHIVVMTPFKFLPIKEFEMQQKSVDLKTVLALKDSMTKITTDVIDGKRKAKELKEKGNAAFQRKTYVQAEIFYSEAIELNIGSRPLWTNRAACRNTMKKYEEAISDCHIALSIDSKCTRSIIQKGNALLGLNRYKEAEEYYNSLHSLQDLIMAKLLWLTYT